MRGRSHIRHDAVHRYGLIGLVVMGVLGALIFLSYRTDNGLPWQSHYEIHADVADATRIVHHDEVRIGGVRVGQVTSVTAMRAHGTGQPFARLALSLDKSVGRLPSDTRVQIRSASLLGRSYVELEPGHSARTIPPGGGIGQRRVIPTVDMQDLLDVFDRATARATRDVIDGMGYGFAGRGQDFNRALASFSQLLPPAQRTMRAIASPAPGFPRYLRGFEATADALEPVASDFASFFANAGTTFGAMRASGAGLGETI